MVFEQGSEFLLEWDGGGRACGDDAFERRKRVVSPKGDFAIRPAKICGATRPPISQNFEDDGRGEHVCDVELLNGGNHFSRISFGWDGECDIGDDGGDAEKNVDEGVKREGGQVNFI